jgi:hypothetical protein
MTTDPRGAWRIRASDAEREQFAQIMRAAMTEGRLSLEEGEERLARVYAATYRDELAPLVADLPDGGRQALYESPEERSEFRKGLRRHISLVAIAAGVLIGLWVLSGAHFFWPIFPLLFLWIGVRRHLRWRRWHRYGGGPGGGWGPGHGWAAPGGGWAHGGPGGWAHGGPPPWARGGNR